MDLIKNRQAVIAGAAGAGLLLLVTAALFSKTGDLNRKLAQSKQLMQKMQEGLNRAEAEKEKTAGENEKLQADAVSYVGINSRLEDEKKALQGRLEELQKAVDNKELQLQKIRMDLDKNTSRLAEEEAKQREKLLKERNELKDKAVSLAKTLNEERAAYHYNLGVAYSKAGLYDEAIEAYENSLKFDPNNADAHYNMAVLYANVKEEPEKAVSQYRRYLKLKPDAYDKDDVEALIKNLE